jgi:hypothetical protein
MIRGQYKYIPRELIEELNNIKISYNINKDADCFRTIAENSRIGREIRLTLDYQKKKRR